MAVTAYTLVIFMIQKGPPDNKGQKCIIKLDWLHAVKLARVVIIDVYARGYIKEIH